MGKIADELNERSKFDDRMIVGSEIRAAICELETELGNKERATLEGVDFAIKIIVGNVVCDKPTVRAICQGIKSHFNLNYKGE